MRWQLCIEIVVRGKTESDVEDTFNEAAGRLSNGCVWGEGGNETSGFYFENSGDVPAAEVPAWIGGDKMTPPAYTGYVERLPNQEAAMLAQAGKRLTTRITDHVQERLQVAADIVGATLNQFVVQAALEKAERVIESESTILLTRRESLRLLEMIENPPPRNKKFLQAQARYQRTKSHAGSTAERRA